ncbi:hypothetical protein G6F43_007073 [Rhizopus delemar]|nr:hypothetical protein G6F43_007073 [Rhizopus delemar]
MMQTVFANLPKRKYKPVDLKAFDEAISEGITREYNSSQTRNAMYQHDGFNGVGRSASRGRDHCNQVYRNTESCAQGTPSFGRECRGFSRNSNVVASIESVIKNEYDGHASLNSSGPDRGFGALSNNVNTQRWYAQPDEIQSHQPFLSRQSTLEQQNVVLVEVANILKIEDAFTGTKQEPSTEQKSSAKQEPATAADRAARFDTTSKNEIYAQMKKKRVVEREQANKDGLIPGPNALRRLENAIDFRSTCETKCPEFEMIEREIQNNVDRLSTLDYLIQEVMSTCPLEKCHAFIRDRTRSIIQHFTLQSIRDVTDVKVYERIARFHILCLHEMCVLLSLMEFYEDLREEGIEAPNEAEFRAYYIVTHIRDKDVARQISSQPAHIFKHPYVKQALKFHAMAQRNDENEETSSRCNKEEKAFGSQNNYASFFKLIADPHTSFLMACLLETHSPKVRKGALKAMSVAYMARAAGIEAEYVRKVSCYDSLGQCLKEAKHYGIRMDISSKEPTLLFGLKHYESRARVFLEPLSYPAQRKSVFLVEAKKEGKAFSEIVNGCKAIDKQSAPITHAAVYAQHKSSTNESEVQHKSAAKALETQLKRDLLMTRAQEADVLAAEERKKFQELMNLRSMKPRKDISQVDDGPKMHEQRREQRYYCSDWFMLDSHGSFRQQ